MFLTFSPGIFVKILYIIKKEERDSDSLREMIDVQSAEGHEISVIKLYSGAIDYQGLLTAIFANDKVICF